MKRILSIFIFLLLCSPSYAMNVVMMSGEGTSAAGGTENIGSESAGDTGSAMNTAYMTCYKLGETPAHSGSVNSITMTATGDAGAAYGRLSIYNHDAVNDIPSTVVANSATTEITVASGGYTDYTFNYGTKPSVTASAQYWICVSTNATGTLYIRKTETGGKNALKEMTYGDFNDWSGSADGGSTNLMGKGYFVNAY